MNEHQKPIPEKVKDVERINYYRGYLKEVVEAVSRGVKIEGYFAWSFIRNFEWMEGYIPDFGVTYVDFEDNFKRTPKDSARFLKAFWERAVDGKKDAITNGDLSKVAVNGETA